MNDNMTDEEVRAAAIPAATLVLFRERDGAAPELLVVERSAKMAFAGGAIVFPGGRIDPDDHLVASTPAMIASSGDIALDEAAARVAAIRETLEESGIATGFADMPDHGWIQDTRQRLAARELFSTILGEAQHQLDLSQLVPFARWRPGFREARIFDTRFYIARAAADAPEPIVDETENVTSFWASARDLLIAADAEKVRVIFPTRRNLERLALFDDYDGAHAHALSIPVEIVCPQIEERDGERHLCIPTHLGYPITSEILSLVARGTPK